VPDNIRLGAFYWLRPWGRLNIHSRWQLKPAHNKIHFLFYKNSFIRTGGWFLLKI